MSRKATAKAKSKPKASNSRSSGGGGSGGSRFWPGLLVGGALTAAAVHYGPEVYQEITRDTPEASSENAATPPKAKNVSPSPEKPAVSSAKAGDPASGKPQPRSENPPPAGPKTTPPGPSFFRDPAGAANILSQLGMGESFPGSLLWKHTDSLGWNAFGVTATSGGPVSTATAGNSVTCLLESKLADRVQAVRLIANIYEPRGTDVTLAKFRLYAQTLLTETRCPGTREFLEAIDGRLGLQTTSADARFTLSQSPLSPGTRWELTVEAR